MWYIRKYRQYVIIKGVSWTYELRHISNTGFDHHVAPHATNSKGFRIYANCILCRTEVPTFFKIMMEKLDKSELEEKVKYVGNS